MPCALFQCFMALDHQHRHQLGKHSNVAATWKAALVTAACSQLSDSCRCMPMLVDNVSSCIDKAPSEAAADRQGKAEGRCCMTADQTCCSCT